LVQEFLEVEDPDTFRVVAEQSPLVIRRDPFLFAQYFAAMFFINLANLEPGEVRKLFDMFRGKMVIVKSLIKASSIADFLRKEERRESGY